MPVAAQKVGNDMLTGILLLVVLLLVAALAAACIQGMFWAMMRDERRLNSAALWAMGEMQDANNE